MFLFIFSTNLLIIIILFQHNRIYLRMYKDDLKTQVNLNICIIIRKKVNYLVSAYQFEHTLS